MALTEIQQMAKSEFYANLQNFFTEWNRLMSRAEQLQEFLGKVDAGDLDDMGVAAGQVRTDLLNARTVINESLAYHNGTSTAQTEVPADVVDAIRRMV